jgi:hypothetical protein
MSTHALLAPSSAYRWSVCTASVGFIETNASKLPKGSSVYADEGTQAHDLAAAMLTGRRRKCLEVEVAQYGAEMTTCVEYYVNFVLDRVGEGDRLLVERKVPLLYSPSDRGTTDAAIVRRNGIAIVDLKYGAGVSVEAKENKQLAIYAESLIRSLEEIEDFPDEMIVTMVIYQPRDRNNPEPVRQWAVTRAELMRFTDDIALTAHSILAGNPGEFHADPDKQCRFCPAQGICAEYANYSIRELQVVPAETLALPDAVSLTMDQKTRILAAKKGFITWLNGIEDQIMAELLANQAVPGWKLVEGKSNRQWRDPDAAKQLLSNHLAADQIRPPGDVISPAAAEKLLKGIELSTKFTNKFAALIEKPAGKPTLVPEDDQRPALNFDPTKALQDVDVI